MNKQSFIAIGRIPGQCVLIRKDDFLLFSDGSRKVDLKCAVVDLTSGKFSNPITIQQLIDVCPFDEVTDMGEISVLSDLVVETLPDWKLEDLNKTFVRIKKPFNRLEIKAEPQSP